MLDTSNALFNGIFKMKKSQNITNDYLKSVMRPAAFLLLLLLLPSLCLYSCRRAPAGQPGHSLVVGIDELTDPYASDAPDATAEPSPDTTDVGPGVVTEPPAVSDTKPVTEETTQKVDVLNYDYEVKLVDEVIAEAGSQKSRKILRYPQLTGLSNETMQTKINELLGEIAAVEFKNRLLGLEEYTKSGVAVKYEITDSTVTYLGGNLLTVRSQGTVSYSDETPRQNFVYANVINLSTGRNVSQKTLYSNFGEIKKLFEGGRFKQISGTDRLLTLTSLTDIMSAYSLYELYNTYPETYFTPKELVISVELSANLGGYAEFSIPLSEVNGYLTMSPTK